jgi:hypothetical protein
LESEEKSIEDAEPKEENLNRHPRRDLEWYSRVTQEKLPFQKNSNELIIDIDDLSIENNEDSLELITIKNEKR